MATTATIQCRIDINRTLTIGVANASNPNILLSAGAVTNLTASTTPDAENGAAPSLALSGGTLTVDLTALTDDINGATADFTGKIVRALIFENTGTNSMTFTIGASNGLAELTGTTIVLAAGKRACVDFSGGTAGAVISSTNKTIDVTGTGSETFDLGVVVG